MAASLIAAGAQPAIGGMPADIPGVPPPQTPPPPPPTPAPTYTPPPFDPNPGYTAPPDYLIKPGEIGRMYLSFRQGRVTAKWSTSERATSYQARITKLVLNLSPKGPKYKKPKPQPWKETTKRGMVFDVTSEKRYRIQVRGKNSAGVGPITQQVFLVP
jgi:hypothetical protein